MSELQVISTRNQTSNIHIMLCHGFGATNRDLVDLSTYLDPSGKFAWHFPQAPIQIPGYNGYAWFPRAATQLSEALSGSYFNQLAELRETGLVEASAQLGSWIREMNLTECDWILGGFSQGSMVALQTALQVELKIRAVLILSGSLINQTASNQLTTASKIFPIFQSHGIQDPVLPIAGALALKELLLKNHFLPEWHEFNGGHEIPWTVLEALKIFITKLSADH